MTCYDCRYRVTCRELVGEYLRIGRQREACSFFMPRRIWHDEFKEYVLCEGRYYLIFVFGEPRVAVWNGKEFETDTMYYGKELVKWYEEVYL